MNVVMFTSEAVPFAKTGGLADVCGALPIALAERGHRCRVVMPAFRHIFQAGIDIKSTDIGFSVPVAGRPVAARLLKAELPNSPVEFYFIDQPQYFDRSSLYGDSQGDYRDNCERFAFFSRAAVHAVELLGEPVDVAHAHDWPTGLVPALISVDYRHYSWYRKAVSVLTIHNLAYQGRYWHWDMQLTGLDWKYFNWQQMEYYGDLNLLKTGIVFSDWLTTVSNRYAEEIQQPDFGFGLDGVLRDRKSRLTGIVNGVDYHQWNPEKDRHLPIGYTTDNWRDGKREARKQLQQELGMPFDPSQPLVGLVGRLADQKGWDLVIPLLQSWLHRESVQWVILGTGDQRYHDQLGALVGHAGHRLAVRLEFSDRLAHLIEAGSDIFLMPSRFEPCGLNQLYSLRYGAVPVVHSVGGLVDTVTDVTHESIASGTATGFSFADYSLGALENALHRALAMYRQDPQQWARIVETGMRQDWSWKKSAERYEQVYQQAAQSKFGNALHAVASPMTS